MAPDVFARAAHIRDAAAISALNNHYVDHGQMLRRSPDMIEEAIVDSVVVQNPAGQLLACGALAAIAVSAEAHGRGLGRAIVRAVEALARKRGVHEVFALTLEPAFFAAVGYQRVDRARYPEKNRRDCITCARRVACNETCFTKSLLSEQLVRAA